MGNWDSFYKRYKGIKNVTKLLVILGIVFALLFLVSLMIYSELSAASDNAKALIEIAIEQTDGVTVESAAPAAEEAEETAEEAAEEAEEAVEEAVEEVEEEVKAPAAAVPANSFGYDPKMDTGKLPQLFIDHYDEIMAAVPEAEARHEAGDLLIVYHPNAKILYRVMSIRFVFLYCALVCFALAIILMMIGARQKFDRDVTCPHCGAVTKGSVIDKNAGKCPKCGKLTTGDVLLEARKVNKIFGTGKNQVHAVNNVDFVLHRGEIISIVGESGSGKTTFAKIMLGLLNETNGEILYNGSPRFLDTYPMKRAYWQNIQAIFQDPFSTFNQFFRVEKILNDCLVLQGLGHLSLEEKRAKMRDACQFVNLKYEELYNKYPFELSGGQMQRLMIARIFMMQPNVLIADEPTSMIDACSRSTILDMLLKLRDERGMTIVFITHDLGLAYYVSDTLYIMEKGQMVEKGPADDLILNPQHRYTKQLVTDVPKLNEEWELDL